MMSQLGGSGPGHGLLSPAPLHHPRYPDTSPESKHIQERFEEMRKSVGASLGQLKPYDLVKVAGHGVGPRFPDHSSDTSDAQPQDLSVRYPPHLQHPPPLQYPPMFIKREPSPGGRAMSPPPLPLVPVKTEPEDTGYRLQELGHLYPGPDLVRSYSMPTHETGDHSDTDHGVTRQMSLDRADKRHSSSERGQEIRPGPVREKEEREVNSSRTIIGTTEPE